MHPWAAAVTGAFGGILYVQTSDLMLRFQLDDVVNAVAIHLSPGIWGCLAVGLFATEPHMKRAYPPSSFEPCASSPRPPAAPAGNDRPAWAGRAAGPVTCMCVHMLLDSATSRGLLRPVCIAHAEDEARQACRDVDYDVGVAYGGNGKLLGMQFLGVVVLLTWCASIILPLFLLLRHFKVLRIPTDAQISVHVRNPPSPPSLPRPTPLIPAQLLPAARVELLPHVPPAESARFNSICVHQVWLRACDGAHRSQRGACSRRVWLATACT